MKSEPILRAKAIQFIDYPSNGGDVHDVQLLKTGLFFHPAYGEINITPEYLNKMVKNFQDKVRGVDLAIDYSHNSEDIAAGWIENVYLQDNELWAKVRWTPKGKQIVTEKEFRYLSADFSDNYVNETQISFGPTLFGAGLTNRPFLKGMNPVLELSDQPIKQKGKLSMDEKDKKIAELETKLAELTKSFDELKTADEENKKKLAELESQKAAAAAAQVLSEKKAAFDALMAQGKAVEAQRVHYMSGDTIKFAESFIPPNLGGQGSSKDAPPAQPEVKDKAEATAKIMEVADKLLKEKKAKHIGEAQAMALRENPEWARKIYG